MIKDKYIYIYINYLYIFLYYRGFKLLCYSMLVTLRGYQLE